APALMGLLLLPILRILGVAGISRKSWSGLEPRPWIGRGNYREIFTGDFYFAHSIAATLYFGLGAVISGIVYSFLVALMLNQKIPARGFWRSVFFLPYVVPAIGTSIVWSWMYEANFGVFNYVLRLLHMEKLHWLSNERLATPS